MWADAHDDNDDEQWSAESSELFAPANEPNALKCDYISENSLMIQYMLEQCDDERFKQIIAILPRHAFI